MIKYLGHSPEGTPDIGDFIQWAGGTTVSDDGQRQLFVPSHLNPLSDQYTTDGGDLDVAMFRRRNERDFSWGLPVISSPFSGKFFQSEWVRKLTENADNLMRDQFGNPHVPNNTSGEGDTYFVIDSYPGGPRCEHLQMVERVQRQMARETAAMFVEHPEWKSQLVGAVMAGEMKYPHHDYHEGLPRWYDYSSYALEAYQWYTFQYIGAGKRWETFADFKNRMGIPARKFAGGVIALLPPRSALPDAPEWNRLPSQQNESESPHFKWWNGYRLWQLKQHITDTVRWWKEEGVETTYWGSQAVQLEDNWRKAWSLMDERMLRVEGVVPGISLYRKMCSSTQALSTAREAVKAYPGYGWNSFQWNPGDTVSTSIEANLSVLRLQYAYGAQVLNLHTAQIINVGMLSDGDCAIRRWMGNG